MTNTLKTYLLTLFTLLLSGYGFLYAHFNQGSAPGSSIKILEKSTYSNFDPNPDKQALVIGHASSGRKEIVKIYSEKNEEENDKLTFLPTYTEASHYLTAFYSRASGHYLIKRVRFCPHWLYASSDRCIVLRMIRI